jgi:hypothetical protein
MALVESSKHLKIHKPLKIGHMTKFLKITNKIPKNLKKLFVFQKLQNGFSFLDQGNWAF